MPIKRQTFTVGLTTPDGEVVEHVVAVGPGDQLRAEFEGNKRGLLPGGVGAHRIAFSGLSVYFALVRLGLYSGDFNTFIHTDCYEYDPVEEGSEDVDPTSSEGPSPSDSPSPTASPAPPTGSTPTSTSGS